jgi:glutamine synthetase
VIKRYITTCKAIRFDGNGYSDEWKQEAKKRGLDCETSVPLIIEHYVSDASINMFKTAGVLSEAELHSRCEVKWNIYTKKVQIESRVLGDLVMNHIVPVATRYQSILLDNVVRMKEAFSEKEAKDLAAQDRLIIRRIAEHVTEIVAKADDMLAARKKANRMEGERAKAIAYHDTIVPLMEEIRKHVDELEMIVDDEMWTLPKYRELLFIR